MQPNSGQPLSQPDRTTPRRHNVKRCRFGKRQAIIYALANHESVESIRRNYRVSRHTILAIREQYPREIKAAQKRIKAQIEMHCYELHLKALNLIEEKMDQCSPWQLLKVCDALTNKVLGLDTPVQKHPYPLSIKFAALRRAKRNQSSVVSDDGL